MFIFYLDSLATLFSQKVAAKVSLYSFDIYLLYIHDRFLPKKSKFTVLPCYIRYIKTNLKMCGIRFREVRTHEQHFQSFEKHFLLAAKTKTFVQT